MLYDETEYPEPGNFKPERHIIDGKSEPRNPADVIFGFGRRFVVFTFAIYTKKYVDTKFLYF